VTEVVVRAKDLGKCYRLYDRPGDRLREVLSPFRRKLHREVWVLRGVDVEIERGTVTGLVGVNGAGKSTLLKLLAGALAVSEGTLEVCGRVSSILELGTGFQPNLTGRQNVFVNALFMGIRPWEVEHRIDDVVAFAGIGDYADQPLSTYSSGMQARLAFANLTLLDPEILLLDEALATGDTGFSEKCKGFIRSLCRSGCTTILAGHDLGFITEACDRVLWIDKGVLRQDGAPAQVVDAYRDHIRVHGTDIAPRPKHLLLRFESTDPGAKYGYAVHGFQWLGPADEGLAYYPITQDDYFNSCLVGAWDVGTTLPAIRSGWGQAQRFPGKGGFRPCRPDLGVGGACLLVLPIPQHPQPLAAKLRVYLQLKEAGAPPLRVSALINGRFEEQFVATPPWPFMTEMDLRAAFSAEETLAPPLAEDLLASAREHTLREGGFIL
jgi:ABC-type polysaccharide/polyol phosphate transport system ATPase subunit